MRIAFKLVLAALLGVGASTQASAIMIVGGAFNGTDVGARDIVEDQASNINGEQAEIDFVNNALGTGYTSLLKSEDVDWYNTDTAGVIAFQLVSEPGSYIVKNATTTVLLTNVASTGWGVLDLSDVLLNLNLGDDMQISHVSEFGQGQFVTASEPATLWLIGAAILGFGLSRRRTV